MEKKKAPKTVYIFSNGSAICFDDAGQQMGELQAKGPLELWFEWLESQGVDPREIGKIETMVNGRDRIVKPIKSEFGWSCHFIPSFQDQQE